MENKIKKIECGWRYLEMTSKEIIDLIPGSFGICDDCSMPDLVGGAFIPVLNRWYCKKCFEDWAKRANFYASDVHIEEKNLQYILSFYKNK